MATVFRHLTYKAICLVALNWLILCNHVYGQQPQRPDTAITYSLSEITVTEHHRNSEVRSSAPLQILNSKTIEKLNVLQVSDAVKYFSGVTVKDYGGIGGLKTVSVRSLGANHTAVSYDGITLSDTQTGQIDLGRFSLENVDMVSLSNGQSDNIFQPARLFASSSILHIRTLAPRFKGNKTTNGKVSIKTGSFGLLNPSWMIEKKISPLVSTSFNGELLWANGKYPYTLQYGSRAGDSISRETRQNTDVKNLRLEGAIYAGKQGKQNGYIKAYYHQSERGLPGATILYNAESSSKQRIWDNTFFAQAQYQNDFSAKWALKANAKYNRGYLHYLDPTYKSQNEKLENTYVQQELYGSASALFRAFENVSFSASTDLATNILHSDLAAYNRINRYTSLTALAAKYVGNRVMATASMLATKLDESIRTGNPYPLYLSPFASIAIKPVKNEDLRVRFFYKNVVQVPTFNDLHYPAVGNRNLKPERANQLNAGITYTKSIGPWLPLLSLTMDGYHNDVKDKIVSFPNKNTFGWTTLNLGRVSITGLDMTAEAIFKPWKKTSLVLGSSYTYQRALNVTNPADRDYLNQIPYTPRVSGSGKAGIETPWINLSYTVLWSGHRYILFQNYAENRLPGYSDHSLSVSRTFGYKNYVLFTSIEVLNLLDENYAIVKWFPMPGRSVRGVVSLKF